MRFSSVQASLQVSDGMHLLRQDFDLRDEQVKNDDQPASEGFEPSEPSSGTLNSKAAYPYTSPIADLPYTSPIADLPYPFSSELPNLIPAAAPDIAANDPIIQSADIEKAAAKPYMYGSEPGPGAAQIQAGEGGCTATVAVFRVRDNCTILTRGISIWKTTQPRIISSRVTSLVIAVVK